MRCSVLFSAASFLAFFSDLGQAWVPNRSGPLRTTLTSSSLSAKHEIDVRSSFDPFNLGSDMNDASRLNKIEDIHDNNHDHRALWIGASALVVSSTPGVASAATAATDALPSAFAAYAHYLSLLLMTASIVTERLTVKPAMSIKEEKLLGYADITTGVAGSILAISGYYRATAYGKGWDFYSHEPMFWLKMTLLGIFGGLSLFPTITIIQRTVKIERESTIDPMSEELATRMKKVLNAELTALAFIPLTATLMSRGVGYVDDFPTQTVGPVLFGIITAGAVFKYVKDAITWDEKNILSVSENE